MDNSYDGHEVAGRASAVAGLALWLVLAASLAGNIAAPLLWPGTVLQPVFGAVAVASVVLLVVRRLRRSR